MMAWTMQNPDADPVLSKTDFIASGTEVLLPTLLKSRNTEYQKCSEGLPSVKFN